MTADIIRLDYQGKGIAGDLCEKFVISSLSLNPSLVIVGEILWNNIPGIASQRKVIKRESFVLNGITAEEIYDVDRRLHIFTYRKMNP